MSSKSKKKKKNKKNKNKNKKNKKKNKKKQQQQDRDRAKDTGDGGTIKKGFQYLAETRVVWELEGMQHRPSPRMIYGLRHKLLQLKKYLSGKALEAVENLRNFAEAFEAAKSRLQRKSMVNVVKSI